MVTLVVTAALSTACSGSSAERSGAPAPTVEDTPLQPIPSNSPLDCEPNMMASIELGQCTLVGPANVPSSFTKAQDGFRLIVRVAASSSSPATRMARN